MPLIRIMVMRYNNGECRVSNVMGRQDIVMTRQWGQVRGWMTGKRRDCRALWELVDDVLSWTATDGMD